VTRVAVVDIGSNSTRLLVAEVDGGSLVELERGSIVTRLGEGVDATGRLGDEPQRRVFAALDRFAEPIDRHGVDVRTAVLTSAVRDAANGAEFTAAVRDRYGLGARTLSGDQEARLTFLGATAARDRDDPAPLLVIDIGGGSTELVVGAGGEVAFHVSTQVGVVRHTERHLHSDPPTGAELEALGADARDTIEAAAPAAIRARARAAVAVAGSATQCASIDLALDPYDPQKVEGHRLSRARLVELRDRLAAVPLAERRSVKGLDPARAPTIVAGVEVLLEVLSAFGLESVEVSERDILWGVALESTIPAPSQEL
jgi:exopolyphosphatase/guanosine-5'-triphosphate,3'-diphosphate pyrophosphatase